MKRKASARRATKLRDVVEPLERRLLLASISGQLFNDYDADGVKDASEPRLSGWAVYQDLNNNGVQDSAAPVTLVATDVPKSVPDPGSTISNLVVSGLSGTIADVNVTVNLTHSYVGDVTMTLISPGGTRVTLVSRPGNGNDSGDNFSGTVFDDEAGVSITAGIAPFSGTYQPVSPLSALDNAAANGTWQLEVNDAVQQDVGTLTGWSVTFVMAEPVAITDSAGGYTFAGLSAGTYPIREVAQSPFAPTLPASGARTVTVGASDNVTGQDFGNRAPPGEIRGAAWLDANGNGVRDAGEDGMAGIRVYVELLENGSYDAGSEPSALTAADGSYSITTVPPGAWLVREVLPPGYTQTTPGAGGTVLVGGKGAAADTGAAQAADAVTAGTLGLVPTQSTPSDDGKAVDRAPTIGDLPVLPIWAPGTPQDAIDGFFSSMAGATSAGGNLSPFTFDDADRWTRTATNGSGLIQGDATTLTWSIVPDGTPIDGHDGEPAAPSNLRAFLNGIYGSEAVWTALFQQVFDEWSSVTGVSYVHVNYDDGGSGGTELIAQPGQLGVRADVRIGGHRIDGNNNVLAYGFFPDLGDMVIDTGDGFFASNTANNSLAFRNVVAHEHGHGLGLDHVMPVDQTKLMEPYVTTAFDGPQHDDILAANRGYGDRFEKNGGNDVLAKATSLGTLDSGSLTVNNLSVDDDSDVDLYKFTVSGPRRLMVTVSPVGSTYLVGTQGGAAPQPFNSLAQSDLAVQVMRADGTVIATANLNGIGLSETLANIGLAGAGDYYVKVTGSANAAQLYSLSLSVAGALAGSYLVSVSSGQLVQSVDFGNRPDAPPAEVTVLAGAVSVLDGQTTSIDFGTATHGGQGTSRTFTVRNDGGSPLTTSGLTVPAGFIVIEGLNATIAPGTSDDFTVELDPAAVGVHTGSISFLSNDADEGTFDFPVTGTVAPAPPEITVLLGATVLMDGQSAPVDFGSVGLGGDGPELVFTLRNDGDLALTLGALSVPTGYTVTQAPPASLAGGASATFRVRLDTDAAGTKAGTLSLVDGDADENPFDLSLTGVVLAPEVSVTGNGQNIDDDDANPNVADGTDFGSVLAGGPPVSRTFRVWNLGTVALATGGLSVPAGFGITEGLAATIQPGSYDDFTVTLGTASAGSFAGQVLFATNDADENLFAFDITGTVSPAIIIGGTLQFDLNGSATLTEVGGSITISSAAGNLSFAAANVSAIVAVGHSGDDLLTITGGLDKPLSLVGNGGHDAIAVAAGGSAAFGNGDLGAAGQSVGLSVAAGGRITLGGDQHLTNLTIDGGTVARNTSAPGVVTLTGPLTISGGGTLDLGAGSLLVPTAASIAGYIAQAAGTVRSNGLNAWGGKGLTSSIVESDAANDNAKQLALGYFDSRDNGNTGLSVPAGQTLVKVTVYGDATGDGKVSIADLSVWNNNFGAPSPRWSQGDFNFDGKVNIADLSVWNNDFGANVAMRLAGGTIAGTSAAAPGAAETSDATAIAAAPTASVAFDLTPTTTVSAAAVAVGAVKEPSPPLAGGPVDQGVAAPDGTPASTNLVSAASVPVPAAPPARALSTGVPPEASASTAAQTEALYGGTRFPQVQGVNPNDREVGLGTTAAGVPSASVRPAGHPSAAASRALPQGVPPAPAARVSSVATPARFSVIPIASTPANHPLFSPPSNAATSSVALFEADADAIPGTGERRGHRVL